MDNSTGISSVASVVGTDSSSLNTGHPNKFECGVDSDGMDDDGGGDFNGLAVVSVTSFTDIGDVSTVVTDFLVFLDVSDSTTK